MQRVPNETAEKTLRDFGTEKLCAGTVFGHQHQEAGGFVVMLRVCDAALYATWSSAQAAFYSFMAGRGTFFAAKPQLI
jgi:hypothetical protein